MPKPPDVVIRRGFVERVKVCSLAKQFLYLFILIYHPNVRDGDAVCIIL